MFCIKYNINKWHDFMYGHMTTRATKVNIVCLHS